MGSKYSLLWQSAGGKAPKHWDFLPLEELLETPKSIAVGVMYPGGNEEDGVPLVKVSDVKDGKVINKPGYLISDEVDHEYRRTRLNGTEILITLVGNPGDCVIVNEEMIGWNVARALAVLRLKDVNFRYWLRCILLSQPSKHLIDSRLNTTVQKTLNLKDIKELPIPMPPEHEINGITHCVKALEEKIELNRQTNQTLESMAQAMFKSWFVDFDPVIDNALAAGNPIPEPLQKRAEIRQALRNSGEAKSLPAHIQKLFPDSFRLSDEMGWVPEGWEVKRCQDLIDVRDGTHDSPKKSSEGFPLVTSRHITSGKLALENTYLISNDDFEKVNERSKVCHGDILITMIGTVGIPYFVSQKKVDFAIKNIGLFRTSVNQTLRHYFFFLLNSRAMQNYLEERIAGTTQKYLSLKTLRNIELLCPKTENLVAFNDHVSIWVEKISIIDSENQYLSKLRDTLLPKLISGELRVPEAEAQIQEAVA